MVGGPFANLVYGDSFWGWPRSASFDLYTMREPAFEVCVLDWRGQVWGRDYGPTSLGAHVRVHPACDDERAPTDLCAAERGTPRVYACLPASQWAAPAAIQMLPAQRHVDLGFARAAGVYWASRYPEDAAEAWPATVVATLRQRTSLAPRRLLFRCGRSACVAAERGGGPGLVPSAGGAVH